MRLLTMKRAKRYVACLVKMKVFIEDPTGDTMINGTPCRKLGELKNGEEKAFEIPEQSAKVFVIADKLSKNYCNDFYELPEGQEDIFLSGKNKFNLATGNAFRFDNNDSAQALANRKKGGRKGLIVFLCAILAGIAIYLLLTLPLSDLAKKPETFASDGMRITLTNQFHEADFDDFTVSYDSNDVAVFLLKDDFAVLDGLEDWSLEEYGAFILLNNGLEETALQQESGLTYFTYDYVNAAEDADYYYISYLYKAPDAFWMIQFATTRDRYARYADQIRDWARSVEFIV
mgnify:FL=1